MYNVLKNYSIVEYADRMQDLYQDLQTLLKERFPTGVVEFESTDRIMFCHNDLDYFIHRDFPGFHLYNLQLILRELDIPNFVCAVESNIPNYHRYTKMVRDILRPDDVPMRAISVSCEIDFAKHLPSHRDINIDAIASPFVVLSRLSRFHRTLFMSRLFESGLHNKGLVSYHNIDAKLDQRKDDESTGKIAPDMTAIFLTTTPFTMCNNEHSISLESRQVVDSFAKSISSYCNFVETADISNKNLSMGYQQDTIQNALLYVALETSVNYPEPYQSGISFKSIGQKRPFVIFGSPGCIELLKDQGFQTFDRWWNEDYDCEPNLERRIEKIIGIIQDLSSLSAIQLKDLCREMEPVLHYNYQHFTGQFVKDGLDRKHAVLDQQFVDYD